MLKPVTMDKGLIGSIDIKNVDVLEHQRFAPFGHGGQGVKNPIYDRYDFMFSFLEPDYVDLDTAISKMTKTVKYFIRKDTDVDYLMIGASCSMVRSCKTMYYVQPALVLTLDDFEQWFKDIFLDKYRKELADSKY